VWAVSTLVPLTVTGFGNKITTPLCYSASFSGWRTKSFPVRMGPNPRNNLEDKARAVRFDLAYSLRWRQPYCCQYQQREKL